MDWVWSAEHLNITPLADEDVSDVFTPVRSVVSVGERARWTGVPAGGDLNFSSTRCESMPLLPGVKRLSGALFGILPNAHDSSDVHDVNDLSQMIVAGFQDRFNQRFWHLVGGDVLSSLSEQQQWAMVDNEDV
jgi:hypothetical protein